MLNNKHFSSYTYASNEIHKRDFGLRKEKVLLVFKVGQDLPKASLWLVSQIVYFLHYQNYLKQHLFLSIDYEYGPVIIQSMIDMYVYSYKHFILIT